MTTALLVYCGFLWAITLYQVIVRGVLFTHPLGTLAFVVVSPLVWPLLLLLGLVSKIKNPDEN